MLSQLFSVVSVCTCDILQNVFLKNAEEECEGEVLHLLRNISSERGLLKHFGIPQRRTSTLLLLGGRVSSHHLS